MSNDIPINLAVEDVLSEMAMRVILEQSGRSFLVSRCFGRSGFGYLKKNANAFNSAAKGIPYLLLTDLDARECAPGLIEDWLQRPKHNNLIFRVAVREVEAWVIAHRKAFARYLGIAENRIPREPDILEYPKRTLIELTSTSKRRRLREAIVPARGSTARIGPDYNNTLGEFLQSAWKVEEAIKYSPSLKKAFQQITSFQPIYTLNSSH